MIVVYSHIISVDAHNENCRYLTGFWILFQKIFNADKLFTL